ncbi:hypothetical protein D3C79_951360 [compost metagenome]
MIDPVHTPKLPHRLGKGLQCLQVHAFLPFHSDRNRQKQAIIKRSGLAEGLVNQEARQATVTIHEWVQEHEAERDDACNNQRIDLGWGLIGKAH